MSVVIGNQYTQKYYRWTNWKTILVAKALVYQYDDDGTIYTIYGYDGPEVHVTSIYKGTVPYAVVNGYSQAQNDSDKSDFETNYLAGANLPLNISKLTGDTTSTKIGNVGDRLKVDSNISNTGPISVSTTKANVLVTTEYPIVSRSETAIAATLHTVAAGKTFYLTSFCGSFDAPGPIIYVRLKKQTNGIGSFVTISRLNLASGGQGTPVAIYNFSTPIPIGVGGDVLEITVDVTAAKGNLFVSYAGIEI